MRDPTQRPAVAVIDWEFCLAGNCLIDLGNFFRFADYYQSGCEALLLHEYRAAGGELPETWRVVGRLLDLGNMCSFLERKENYLESFRTARSVIASTLAHFGSTW